MKLELEDIEILIDDKTPISYLLTGMRLEYDHVVLTIRTSPSKNVNTFDTVIKAFNGVVPYIADKVKKHAKTVGDFLAEEENTSREKNSTSQA